MIIEIWAAFMVLFGVLTLIAYNLNNYVQPIGFSYQQVWNLDLASNQDTTEIGAKLAMAMQRIRSYKEVESASRMSSNTPFSANQMGNVITHNKVSIQVDYYHTDTEFSKTLDLPLTKGRWYRQGDMVAKFIPIVINKKTEEKLFQDESALNKLIKADDGKSYKVVGVVDKFKAKGEFMSDNPALFRLLATDDHWNSNVLIKTKPGTDAYFEARLAKDLAVMLPGWGIEITYLTESRKNRENLTLVPVLIFLIVSGFLLTNVALGLFGVLNLNIARRKGEIGLRRAMGATEGRVTGQFLGEIWVLATFSMIIGLIFAIQFPLMNVFDLDSKVYIMAILATIAVIYIIVTFCAWFPSKQASQIHPAIALHEE